MDSIREYFISVTVCAILCSVAIGLFEKNSSINKLLNAVCGLILVVTLIRPITDIQLDEITLYTDAVTENARDAVAIGEDYRSDTLCAIIKEETEAYVLSKAAELEADIDVDVMLSDHSLPIPKEITVSGSVSPYAKKQLITAIEKELGIAEEAQLWIS